MFNTTSPTEGRSKCDKCKEREREYKEKAKQAKRDVDRAKRLTWKSWSEELNSNEQQKEMFKLQNK